MYMIIAVIGPTGVGKTKMSIKLAKKYNAEIISCDSMQIYKKMDIGTAKVTEEEKEGIKHHMIDIKDVREDYSVYDYQKDARSVLDKLLKEDKNAIIVGGTGLYLKALLYNYEFKENSNEKKDFSIYTNEELYNMVKKIDSNTKIHVNNRQRLESFLNNHSEPSKIVSNKMIYNAKIIGLTRPREELYDDINKRVDEMIKDGLINEAKYFYDNNINSKAIKTAICYKELYLYFDNKISLNEAIDLIKLRSRRYAKRQYTWFNNQMSVKWFDVDANNFNKTIKEVITYLDNN
ncbi:MAG: tRNA (adenosine(37)-N6)-dimethylallyltransferase MiaA [Bacilli bacterium]|nr:tRNA (adenosine(37)-N6)-dimethylallyltransferase MiaA [Bacilli bacterium]